MPASKLNSAILTVTTAKDMNLSKRELVGELMDHPKLAHDELVKALRELSLLQRLSLTACSLSRELKLFSNRKGVQELHILDLGCGDGSVLKDIKKICARSGLMVRGVGVDLNLNSLSEAKQNVPRDFQFQKSDLLKEFPTGKFDVILSTLFFHHLTDEDSRTLLKKIKNAAPEMILVNDLRRTRLGYMLANGVTQILSKSPIVRFDAPVSVRAAYREDEFLTLANEVGLKGGVIKRIFPERFQYVWHAS